MQYDKQVSFDNRFPTTISVLMSAVQKLARAMKLPSGLRLYRGLGGKMVLPDHFYKPNEFGICGLTENAFLSTTSEKSVALMYSGAKENMPYPVIFEITVGAVDRGACIQDFSQYPGEVR
jgi:hypothetical protein